MIRDSDKGSADPNAPCSALHRLTVLSLFCGGRVSPFLRVGPLANRNSRTRKEAHRKRWASSLIVVRSSRYERRARAAIATPPRPIAVATSSTSSIGMLLPLDEPSKLPVVGGRGVTAGVVGAAVVVAGG